ncbi:MAG: hypothetical protein IPL78_05965 [Chloroflexi bacterium]|nr:hypothetical protein [Chloroflexota bacterium]
MLRPTLVGAQDGVRDVVMAVEVAYGLNWRFTLTATSEVEITQAELFAAAPGLPFTYTTVLPVQSRLIALDYSLPCKPFVPGLSPPLPTGGFW